MGLDKQIASRFIREVSATDKKPAKTTVRGTVNIVGNDTYVILDGSESITPVTTTVGVNDGDRVIVDLDNHSAVVTGNETSNAIDETGFYKLLEDGSLDINVNNLNVDAGGSVMVKSGGSVNLNDKLILNEDGTLSLNIDSLSIGNSESIDNLEDLKGADGAPGKDGAPGEDITSQYVRYEQTGANQGLNLISSDGHLANFRGDGLRLGNGMEFIETGVNGVYHVSPLRSVDVSFSKYSKFSVTSGDIIADWPGANWYPYAFVALKTNHTNIWKITGWDINPSAFDTNPNGGLLDSTASALRIYLSQLGYSGYGKKTVSGKIYYQILWMKGRYTTEIIDDSGNTDDSGETGAGVISGLLSGSLDTSTNILTITIN